MVGLEAGLTPGAYTTGLVAILAVAGALGFGAHRLRAALLPDWRGAPARLAEIVVGLGVLLVAGRLLGSVGALRGGWVLVTTVAAGAALAGAARLVAHTGSPGTAPDRSPPADPRVEVVAAALGVAAVTMQWGVHTAAALSRGMTHPDTLWYHGPFAARFLQQGRIGSLAGLGNGSLRHYPLDSELLHALAAMPFERDLVSPLVNLAALGLVLLAAWSLGRRAGAGALSLLGAAVVLGLPVLTGSQPGQATNDIVPAGLLLAATALLFEAGIRRPAGAALAGVAAGLALGTKLIVAAPVAVLTVGVVVLAWRARRPAAAVGWCVALAASGGHWLIRNWFDVGNPLPWLGLDIGPLSLPRVYDESGTSLVDFSDDSGLWRDLYLRSLSPTLGRAWPLLLGLPLAAAIFAVVRRGNAGLLRLLGATAVAGFASHPFVPYTAGAGFAANLRYLAPALLLGVSLGAVALARFPPPWRRAAAAILAAAALLQAVEAHTSKVSPWPSRYLPTGLLVGLAAGAAVLASAYRPARRSRTAIAATVLVAAGGLGWWLQGHYLERRYVEAGLHLDAVNAYFRDVGGARVGVIGSETYPMFGVDLSNRVEQVEGPSGQVSDRARCREWRRALGDRFDYLVVTRQGGFLPPGPPEEYFATDPSATAVRRLPDGVVLRLDGPFDPDACA